MDRAAARRRAGVLSSRSDISAGCARRTRASRTEHSRPTIRYRLRLREEATLFRRLPIRNPDPPREAFEDAAAGNAVAVVERPDGFYMLSESGELRGPVRAGADDSLPIISGAPLDHVSPADLVEYARALVRAEAELADGLRDAA